MSSTHKNTLMGILLIIIGTAIVCPSPLLGEDRYVLVTLRDNTELKFQYDSFSFNWINPQLKDEFTCEFYNFDPKDLVEIYVLNPTLNKCDQREDEWTFDVSLKGREPVQGFIELIKEYVSGILYGTDVKKNVPFTEIGKVTYH